MADFVLQFQFLEVEGRCRYEFHLGSPSNKIQVALFASHMHALRQSQRSCEALEGSAFTTGFLKESQWKNSEDKRGSRKIGREHLDIYLLYLSNKRNRGQNLIRNAGNFKPAYVCISF
jgi:hypothetical protein